MPASPSNHAEDRWSDVPTIAGNIAPTVTSRAATDVDAAPTVARPYVPDLAWSAEPAEFAAPLPIEQPRPWFMRSAVLTVVGGGLVAAAAAGIFGALHGAQNNSVDPTSHIAPAPTPTSTAAPATTPTPAPTTPPAPSGNQTTSATPSRSVTASHSASSQTSQQSQHTTSSPSGQHTNDQQWHSNNNSVSTPPTWNRNDGFHWFTHLRDHDDSRLTHDRDNRSSGDHGDNSQPSHDQSSATRRSN